MKKVLLCTVAVIIMFSCSTSYNKYDYNAYFQNNEPFVTVDSEQDAAYRIAHKLNRIVRRTPGLRVAVLNFTDEYGDRLNRGVFFADMVTGALSTKRYIRVVEREMLYEIVKEQELSESNLTESRGAVVGKLMNVDAIITGRILRGKWEDQISVRCFKVGTGEVIYASTISIDYRPQQEVYTPAPTYPYPNTGNTVIIDNSNHNSNNNNTTIINNNNNNDNDNSGSANKKPSVSSDGVQNKGKIDLSGRKKKPGNTDDQYITVMPPDPDPEPATKKVVISGSKTTTVKPVYVPKTHTTVKEKSDPTIVKPTRSTTSSSSSSSSSTSVKKSTVIKKSVKKAEKTVTEDPLVEEKGKKTTVSKK